MVSQGGELKLIERQTLMILKVFCRVRTFFYIDFFQITEIFSI